MPLLAPLGEERADLLRVRRHRAVRVHGEAQAHERVERLDLRRRGAVALPPGDGVEEDREAPARRLARVEQAERTRRRVARVREEGLPRLLPQGVERPEGGLAEVDLAADLEEARRPGGQPEREDADRPHVRRDVLSRRPVSARGASHEDALLVDEGDGEAVDLQLADDLRERTVEAVRHAGQPRVEPRLVVRVVEREERHLVPDVREVVDGGPSDAAGGRVGGDDLRVRLLDREELAGEGVVLAVADFGPGESVVEVLVPAELVAQLGGAQDRGVRVLGKRHSRIVGGRGQTPSQEDRAHLASPPCTV